MQSKGDLTGWVVRQGPRAQSYRGPLHSVASKSNLIFSIFEYNSFALVF